MIFSGKTYTAIHDRHERMSYRGRPVDTDQRHQRHWVDDVYNYTSFNNGAGEGPYYRTSYDKS